jgi:hypothetical protein
MRKQVRTRKGEEDDVEQAIRKIDAVDKNCDIKWDFMARESAIASNWQGQNLWIAFLNAPKARQLSWNAHGQDIDDRITGREDAVRKGDRKIERYPTKVSHILV